MTALKVSSLKRTCAWDADCKKMTLVRNYYNHVINAYVTESCIILIFKTNSHITSIWKRSFLSSLLLVNIAYWKHCLLSTKSSTELCHKNRCSGTSRKAFDYSRTDGGRFGYFEFLKKQDDRSKVLFTNSFIHIIYVSS